MEKINIVAPLGERRDRFFARAVGTRFEANVADDATVIDLYDEIGYWGTDARSFRARLKDARGDITLRINSPGGDIFDGIAIYNDLLAYDGNVKVEITGVAASIASIIAMAGDEITIAENAFFMVHNAWTIGAGNRHDMSKIADTLAKIDDAMARTYAARTTTGVRAIKQMMDDETWLTAKEAKDAGFATAVGLEVAPKARFDLSIFNSVPDALVWADEDDDTTPTERDIERALTREAGWTRSKTRAAMKARKTIDNEPLRDAGEEVDFTALAEAVQAVSAILKKDQK